MKLQPESSQEQWLRRMKNKWRQMLNLNRTCGKTDEPTTYDKLQPLRFKLSVLSHLVFYCETYKVFLFSPWSMFVYLYVHCVSERVSPPQLIGHAWFLHHMLWRRAEFQFVPLHTDRCVCGFSGSNGVYIWYQCSRTSELSFCHLVPSTAAASQWRNTVN